MTIPSDTVSGATVDSRAIAPTRAAARATKPLYWSVRREIWENPSIYIAPLVVAGVVLAGFLLGAIKLTNALVSMGGAQVDGAEALIVLCGIAAIAIVATAVIVGFFYCLGALHNERRDRSILFWKSLPVSDLTTVLSKAAIPLVVLPLVTFVIVAITQLIMLAVGSVVLALHGLNVATLWTQSPLVQMAIVLLYGLVALALWYAPIWAWLLLVSGWARRTPFLWAVLPPLALGLVEKMAFGTDNVGALLNYRLNGAFEAAFKGEIFSRTAVSMPQVDLVGFLTTPGLWAGLIVGAAFLAGAVWQRRYRGPL